MDNENRNNDVPYIAFESELARWERIGHRALIVAGVAIAALVATNTLWIIFI